MMTRHTPTRWLGVFVLGSASLCLAQDTDRGESADAGNGPAVWQPDPIEAGTYDDIASYNIFLSDREDLVAEAERQPEPDLPIDTGPPEPVVELPPPDPDAALLLVGISVRGETPTAFIEDRGTGETIELAHLGPFSQGDITAITHNQVTYVIDGKTRTIRIGYTLTGERPEGPPAEQPGTGTNGTPTDTTDNDADTGDATAAPDDGLSDLERRMRERRRNE